MGATAPSRPTLAADALALLEIDERGLDAMDRQLLRAIAEHHAGGPVGLATMAATVSEPIETIEDVVEPYLMQIGLLARTPRGRQLTASGWEHLGLTAAGGRDGRAVAAARPLRRWIDEPGGRADRCSSSGSCSS